VGSSARAWRVTPSTVSARASAANVLVTLRTPRGSRLNLNGSVPTFELFYQYINLNPFPVSIERLDFDVWFGQPVIKHQLWQRTKLPAHAAHPRIVNDSRVISGEAPPHFEFKLDANDTKYIDTQMVDRRLKNDVHVHYAVYGRALGTEFEKRNQLLLIPRHEVDGQG
jgi:hypothetical protein